MQKKKSGRNAERTRKRILDAAEKILADKGLEGARTDEIARKASINKAMLYYYFGSKEKLYEAVLERLFTRILSFEDEILEKPIPPLEMLRRGIESYVDFLHSNRNFVKLMQREALYGGRTLKRLKFQHPTILKCVEVVKQGMDEGTIRPLDPRHFVASLVGMSYYTFAQGAIVDYLWDDDINDTDFIEARKREITDLILKGIKQK